MTAAEAPATKSGSTLLRTGPLRPVAVTAAAAGLALIAAIGGSAASGASAPLPLGDPGPLVRVGLPAVRALTDLAAAATVGGCLLLAGTVSPRAAAWRTALSVVVAGAACWAVLASLQLVLGGADIAGLSPTHPAFGAALAQYATTIETGRLALMALALACVTAVAAAAARGQTSVAWTGLLGAVALVPTGLAGHAAGPGHEIVASAWWLHALGACAWVGGLLMLVVLARQVSADGTLAAVAGRYSTIAGWAFVVVAFTGVVGAIPRLTGWASLLGGYGLLLAGKATLLIALGVAGWWHRRATIGALAAHPGKFWRLAVAEVAGMALAFGLAAALSRTAPPADTLPPADPTPAEIVTGVPLPPPLTTAGLFTEFTPDVLWLVVVAALATAYLRGVTRLHRRGDRWPIGRTISWLLGCLALLYVTCGGLAVYGRVLFSVHMIGHMALSMLVPPFLVFAAPVTLLLRAVTARHDGSRGPREWVLALTESRYFRVIAHPIAAAAIFTFSLVVFYFSPLFGLALRTHLGHELMMIHFLLAGYLFVFAVVGVDPAPRRIGYPLRLLLLFITMAFHAFFAVALMSMTTLLQATYFSSLGMGIDALADQRDGGAIAWAIGEGPTLFIAMVVGLQWARSDARLARRTDRAADRDGEADLAAYNVMLRRRGERDRALHGRDLGRTAGDRQ